MKKYGLLLFSLCSLPFALAAEPHYPSPQGYVNDFANVLDPASRQALENTLSDFERAHSIEIAVATIPSLEGETVETYANTLFKQWGIGKKGKDNGVLIVVALADRKVRIEVGYGLENILTDGRCGQIIRDQMAPYFRQRQYGQGISAAVNAIQSILTGGTPEEPPATPSNSYSSNRSLSGISAPDMKLLLIIVFLLFHVFPATAISLIIAFVIFVLVAVKSLSLIPIVIGFLFDLFVTRKKGFPGYTSGTYGGFGGFGGGGYGGGGFSGGGFGGFGGGGSGGGGASGGW